MTGVLKNGLSSSKVDYYSHSGPQGAEGGHHEEVGLGRLAETRLIAFFIHFVLLKIVGHGHLLVYRGAGGRGGGGRLRLHSVVPDPLFISLRADFTMKNPEFGWGAQANSAISLAPQPTPLANARILQYSMRF
jgi:hypothetical protein